MDLKNIWGSEGKEPLRLQDIGLPKILVIVAVGIVLLVLSLPGTGGSQKKIGKQENSTDVTLEEASEQIEGVVVVASGADSGQTDTEIIAAVQALFPVQAHKIRVMKMK